MGMPPKPILDTRSPVFPSVMYSILTAHSLEVFQRALELDWVETVMFPYNIVENCGPNRPGRSG